MGLPCQTRLNLLLDYEPTGGRVSWRLSARRGYKPGDEAGSIQKGSGYRVIVIAGRAYYAHLVIWKMVTGSEPEQFIDHIDGDRANNSLSNLREATAEQNQQNKRLQKNNKSGIKGVHWDTGHKAWRVVISANKKSHRIGRFKLLDDAKSASERARRELHGDFARIA